MRHHGYGKEKIVKYCSDNVESSRAIQEAYKQQEWFLKVESNLDGEWLLRVVTGSDGVKFLNVTGHIETVKTAHITRLKYIPAILNIAVNILRVGNGSSTTQQVTTQ